MFLSEFLSSKSFWNLLKVDFCPKNLEIPICNIRNKDLNKYGNWTFKSTNPDFDNFVSEFRLVSVLKSDQNIESVTEF